MVILKRDLRIGRPELFGCQSLIDSSMVELRQKQRSHGWAVRVLQCAETALEPAWGNRKATTPEESPECSEGIFAS